MDETSICLFQGHGKGNVLVRNSAKCIQNVSSSVRKTRFTFVAFICDDDVVQPALPQFLFRVAPPLRVPPLSCGFYGS